jgi:hypothetical protein
MVDSPQFDPSLASQLPLPLAQAYRNAHNQRESRARHEAAIHLFTAYLDLVCCALLAVYRGQEKKSPQIESLLSERRPTSHGLGWKLAKTILTEYSDADPDFIGRLHHLHAARRRDWPNTLALYNILAQRNGKSVTCIEFFDRLIEHRNRVVHGQGPSPLDESDRRWAGLILAGMAEILRSLGDGILADHRLRYVVHVKNTPGCWEVSYLDLTGEIATLQNRYWPIEELTQLPNSGHVYLTQANGSIDARNARSLDPFIRYDERQQRMIFWSSSSALVANRPENSLIHPRPAGGLHGRELGPSAPYEDAAYDAIGSVNSSVPTRRKTTRTLVLVFVVFIATTTLATAIVLSMKPISDRLSIFPDVSESLPRTGGSDLHSLRGDSDTRQSADEVSSDKRKAGDERDTDPKPTEGVAAEVSNGPSDGKEKIIDFKPEGLYKTGVIEEEAKIITRWTFQLLLNDGYQECRFEPGNNTFEVIYRQKSDGKEHLILDDETPAMIVSGMFLCPPGEEDIYLILEGYGRNDLFFFSVSKRREVDEDLRETLHLRFKEIIFGGLKETRDRFLDKR